MHATDRLTNRRSAMLTQQQPQQQQQQQQPFYWSIAATRQKLRQKHKQHTFEIKWH